MNFLLPTKPAAWHLDLVLSCHWGKWSSATCSNGLQWCISWVMCVLLDNTSSLQAFNQDKCHVAKKKKESKRGGSRWESNPGHLWLETPLFCHFRFPLFSPHNIYIHLFPVWGKMLWAFNQDAAAQQRSFNCLQKPSFRSEKLNTIQNINHSSYHAQRTTGVKNCYLCLSYEFQTPLQCTKKGYGVRS